MDEVMFGQGMLERAGASVQYPATPQLRARVLATIAAPQVRRVERWRVQALPALATVAIVLAAAVGVTLAMPSSRSAVAEFFGIEGSKVQPLPTAPPGTTPTPFATPQAIDANATPSSLAAAAAEAGFEPALPSSRTPSAAYTAKYGAVTGVILRYDAFDLWELRTDGQFEGIFQKGVPVQVTITDLLVGEWPARWITGAPHIVEFVDGAGVTAPDPERVVERSTLIWRTEFALYRMETNLPLEEARAIAETLP